MIHVFHTPTGWKVCQEYPKEPDYIQPEDTNSYAVMTDTNHTLKKEYDQAVALSIANAVDVREEDWDYLKNKVNWASQGIAFDDWEPDDNYVYSLPELEMEIKERCSHGCRLEQIRTAAINVKDGCLNGDVPTCVFYSKLAHVFRKKEEPKMEESQDDIEQGKMASEIWNESTLPLGKFREYMLKTFHLTRVKAELKGEKK